MRYTLDEISLNKDDPVIGYDPNDPPRDDALARLIQASLEKMVADGLATAERAPDGFIEAITLTEKGIAVAKASQEAVDAAKN